ncbi:type II toxin-antitoxin system VapB family antitoxin [Mycobacterium bourgelatii]|uniref:Antitoxin VapB n=1 Tax=Mycobacterium bourgelatii TaxID=1273442 RepID=A0A7I9YIJ5_MYCBU|nr:type II toxin-antitoxin system VapB family antitoxin [Mycobacterium bourgelatii]MCV6977580.1 type II toxin-antitoxin system VapB family antitoxin [Mycobacterium bourgelatii]GFG88497.1 antitoxin VapB [Mycobacterium bourgelatii]
MLRRLEILVDSHLLDEVIERYHLADAREAVHLALNALLADSSGDSAEPAQEEYDEFSDLSAWDRSRQRNSG